MIHSSGEGVMSTFALVPLGHSRVVWPYTPRPAGCKV